jgi:hypothetical protein
MTMHLPPVNQTQRATNRRRRRGPAPTEKTPDSGTVFIESIGQSLYVFDVMNRPLISAFVSEDFFWRTAKEAWTQRRPAFWHLRQRSAWRRERGVLDAKRDRVRALAEELGITRSA